MWLLNANSLELEHFEGDAVPSYSILSHRWGDEEVTFSDIQNGCGMDKKGWRKIELCCNQALRETSVEIGYAEGDYYWGDYSKGKRDMVYVWIDTCCIDKSNSSELSEAINSMYRWYENAKVCYAFLADVHHEDRSSFESSAWFTRCWTLQELLAPTEVHFYDCSWRFIGQKRNMGEILARVTGIPETALWYFKPRVYPIAEKMSWAAKRQSTRKEDVAYSLLGLFQVNMPMIYGEGVRAFQRLLEEILRRNEDLSIFAWSKARVSRVSESVQSGVLASSPADYIRTGEYLRIPTLVRHSGYQFTRVYNREKSQGTSLTSAGISIDMYLIPFAQGMYLAPVAERILRNNNEDAIDSTSGSAMPTTRTDVSATVSILIGRLGKNSHYRRMSVGGSSLLNVPAGWMFRGQMRRVVLANEPIHTLGPDFITTQVLHGIRIGKVMVSNGHEKHVQLFSRTEDDTQPKDLVIPVGSIGIVGIVRFDFPEKPVTFLHFGYDFDLNLFCLITRPQGSPASDHDNLRLSIPRLGMWGLSPFSSTDMMRLVTRLQVERDMDRDTMTSDRVAFRTMIWQDSESYHAIDGVANIRCTKIPGTMFRIQVDIDTRDDMIDGSENETNYPSYKEELWHKRDWHEIEAFNQNEPVA